VDDYGQDVHVALQERDLLAIGRALKAWPLPLLHVVEVYHHSDWLNCNDEPRFILSEEEHADAEENLRPSHMLASTGAPGSGRRLDQRDDARLLARAAAKGGGVCQRSGMHVRLGATSGVSWLDEQALDMIADEVLGGWGLLKECLQELVAANV
jgi:hypothetical protein